MNRKVQKGFVKWYNTAATKEQKEQYSEVVRWNADLEEPDISSEADEIESVVSSGLGSGTMTPRRDESGRFK